MFQLTDNEHDSLRCQIGTSKVGRGGARYLPMAFTEYGVLMLSSVLNSPRAIKVNIQIMRTFARIRQMLAEKGVGDVSFEVDVVDLAGEIVAKVDRVIYVATKVAHKERVAARSKKQAD